MKTRWQGNWADEQACYAWGIALGRAAKPGDCIAMVGEMGAGKTTLSRAIAEGFGVNVAEGFSSPTYTLVNVYDAAAGALLHADLYRLHDEDSAYALGIEDSFTRTDAVLLIEWADRMPALLPANALWLHLSTDSKQPQLRHWRIEAEATVGARLLGSQGATKQHRVPR